MREIGWDESVYMGMAKYLYTGGAGGLWEVIRPPLLPLLAGPLWKAGLPVADAARLIAVLFSALYVGTTFVLARDIDGKAAAWVATALALLAPPFLEHAGHALADIPATSLVLAALILVHRRRETWAGAATGLAFLAKFTHLLAAAPLVLSLALERRGPTAVGRYLMGLALPLAGFLLFSLLVHGREVGAWSAMTLPLTEAMRFQDNPYLNLPASTLVQKLQSLFHYPIALLWSPAGSLLFVAALGAPWLPATTRRHMRPLAWTLAAFLVYFSVIPFKAERFLVFFLPLVAIPAAAVMVHVLGSPRMRVAAVPVAVAAVLPLLPALLRDASWARGPDGPDRAQQRELFGYFETRPVPGPILTASPLFCVFSDARFVPVYDTRRREDTFINTWERRLRIGAAAYSPSGFACGDRPCVERRDRLLAEIERTLVFAEMREGLGQRWGFFIGRKDAAR